MTPKYPDRVTIAHLPTPLEEMPRLSKHLSGPRLFIKRDDQTGLATGGNKTRKLEFLVADALAQGCDYLVTTGGVQSNHCRQTAAAAAKFGLGCSLVLSGQPPTDPLTGNLLLDQLLGAHLYWTGTRTRHEVMADVAAELRTMGHKPYMIPLGGSNVMGATGYVKAMEELSDQLQAERLNVDFVVFGSSSGGTQAGMVLGAAIYNFQGQIISISIDHPAAELQTQVAALATACLLYTSPSPRD